MYTPAEEAKVNILFVAQYGSIHLSQLRYTRKVAVDDMSKKSCSPISIKRICGTLCVIQSGLSLIITGTAGFFETLACKLQSISTPGTPVCNRFVKL